MYAIVIVDDTIEYDFEALKINEYSKYNPNLRTDPAFRGIHDIIELVLKNNTDLTLNDIRRFFGHGVKNITLYTDEDDIVQTFEYNMSLLYVEKLITEFETHISVYFRIIDKEGD